MVDKSTGVELIAPDFEFEEEVTVHDQLHVRKVVERVEWILMGYRVPSDSWQANTRIQHFKLHSLAFQQALLCLHPQWLNRSLQVKTQLELLCRRG
jgi:hypothetical protein